MPLDLERTQAERPKNLDLLTDEGNLDCLGDVIGVGHDATAVAESLAIEVNGRPCHILGIEALTRSKAAMGRPRDLLAITELRALLERSLDAGGSDPGRQAGWPPPAERGPVRSGAGHVRSVAARWLSAGES